MHARTPDAAIPTRYRDAVAGERAPLPRLTAVSIAVGVIAITWAGLTFLIDSVRFAVLSPQLQVAIEAAASFARIFGALVLFLFAEQRNDARLRWLALAVALLGAAGLVFGYIVPAVSEPLSYNTSIVLSAYVWSLAAGLIVVGYCRAEPPSFRSGRTRAAALVALLVLPLLSWHAGDLPSLVNVASFELAATTDHTILRGLTWWHWTLSSIPLWLAAIGLIGVYRRSNSDVVGGWLLLAMTCWVASQLHNLFWPSGYIPILTTAGVLRLSFAAVIAISGVIGWREAATAFRRLAEDRAALLIAERETTQRLAELALLRSEFTSMVAHELGNPVAAIRRQTELLAWRAEPESPNGKGFRSILAETELLDMLITDVQEIAAVERADFRVQIDTIPIGLLMADAATFGETLGGGSPVTVETVPVRVRADPDRIGQVLRNLVINAVNYSPAGSPIRIVATKIEGGVRLEVIDRGPGIPEGEQAAIFEKFTRGREREAFARGAGLGLYVARRIVQAHGSDLTVFSVPGEGSTFAFTLPAAP